MTDQTLLPPLSRRRFVGGAGSIAVGFMLYPALTGEAAAAHAGLVRVNAANPGSATESWLVLTPEAISIHAGKVELGTGVQTALTQIVLEELYLTPADATVEYIQGDTAIAPTQGGTVGSKSLQNGGPELRQAAATAFSALQGLAEKYFGVPRSKLVASGGRFSLANNSNKNVKYEKLLRDAGAVVTSDPAAPQKPISSYNVVGTDVPRVDLPDKVTAKFEYVCDVTVPGMLHGRVIRPQGRNSKFGSFNAANLARAQAIPGFVQVVQNKEFVGVIAESEWAAAAASAPATGLTVNWIPGAPVLPMATLDSELRNPANHYRTLSPETPFTTNVEPAIAASPHIVDAQYFTPYQMHGPMHASSAVAHVRSAPDPDTGFQATIWSGTQNVTALRGAIASLLGLNAALVHVIYTESSGCYGHDGVDDAAADAALLSQAVNKPVRVQWTRANEHGWEPLGAAAAHDMRGGIGPDGVRGWKHTLYAATANSRPNNNAGTLLAGHLTGGLPANLPTNSGNASGRNAAVTYTFPHRLESRLVKSFETTGPTSATPSTPLTWKMFRTTALRSLGGFSNSFANESFLDELAHAAGLDPLKLRIDSMSDPRALAVLNALKPAWNARPAGGNGVGAGVGFQQYERENAYAATYCEVTVDKPSGKVKVTRVVCAHDCGIIVNPDGLRNQIEGNVIQGISRTLKEQVGYTADRVTSTSWSDNPFAPGVVQYEVLRFNEVPEIECILINRPDQPAWGAGEPAIGTLGGAVGNAIFAATGVRFRSLPITPDKVKARWT